MGVSPQNQTVGADLIRPLSHRPLFLVGNSKSFGQQADQLRPCFLLASGPTLGKDIGVDGHFLVQRMRQTHTEQGALDIFWIRSFCRRVSCPGAARACQLRCISRTSLFWA